MSELFKLKAKELELKIPKVDNRITEASQQEIMDIRGEYKPYEIKQWETLYSIALSQWFFDVSWKNSYHLLRQMKNYNLLSPIENQPDGSSGFDIIKPDSDVNQELPTWKYIRIPTMREYKLSPDEQKRKSDYEKLFEWKDELLISTQLKRGTMKVKNLADVDKYLKLYQQSLKADGYEKSIDEIKTEFKERNKFLHQRVKENYGSLASSYYDGWDTIPLWITLQVPLYKYINEKTIINDLPENEKYTKLDKREERALDDTIAKMSEPKSKYAILVNITKESGKHQVVLCDVEAKSVIKRYLCSEGSDKLEKGKVRSTPRWIFTLKDKKRWAGFPRWIYWRDIEHWVSGIDENNGNGAKLPRMIDIDGNYTSSPWHNIWATMTSRIMPLNYWGAVYLHGSNKVNQLWTKASHGCIRMLDEDIMELFELTPPWTYVNVMDPMIYNNINTITKE